MSLVPGGTPMSRTWSLVLLAPLALSLATIAPRPTPLAAEEKSPGSVGAAVRPFTVRQPDGGTVTLPEHVKDAKAAVVVFLSFDCPVAKSYVEPLNALAKSYADKGVAVVGVCPDEGAAEVKKRITEFKV